MFLRANADFELEAIIQRLVREWGDADLNQLLDYVYFETEPMHNAKRGDVLDFSTVGPAIAKKIQLKLDGARLKEIRKKLAERAKEYAPLRQAETNASDLSENLAIWDEEEKVRFPSGPCKIRLGDLVPKE